jgi:hypothetical protein
MARDQLLEFVTDVERLVTAGAESVAGHERLARHAESLRKLAGQVPALRALLPPLETALSSGPDAAAALLELLGHAGRLRGALAAPGDHAGALEEPGSGGTWATPLPVRAALTAVGRVRTSQTHRDRLGRGKETCPDDLRVVGELLRDLDGANDWLADCLADEVLPRLGPAVAGELTRAPSVSDLGGLRRLVALCRIDPAAGRAALERLAPDLVRQLDAAAGP